MLPPLAALVLRQQLSLYSIVISKVPQPGHLLHSLQLPLQSPALCQQQCWQMLLQLPSPRSQSHLTKTGPALPGVSTLRNANIAKVSHFGLSALLCISLRTAMQLCCQLWCLDSQALIAIVTLSVTACYAHTCCISVHEFDLACLTAVYSANGHKIDSVSISAALFSMFKPIPVFPIL